MWCELVLNGIGGSTIEEAKERLSIREFQLWNAYRAKRGSLNPSLRQEFSIATLAALYANSHRSKGAPPFGPTDFTPYHEEPAVSLDQAMATWH